MSSAAEGRSRRALDPFEAWGRGVRDLTGDDLAWFRSQGVPLMALLGERMPPDQVRVWRAHGLDPAAVEDPAFRVARARVRFLRNRRFAFERDGRAPAEDAVPAYVMPEFDEAMGLLDIVAWHPRSRRVASWAGTVGLLGSKAIEAAGDVPLQLWPSPLEWLRAWRSGAVVVNDALARPTLLDAGTILTADVDHGIALQAMLTKVRLPRILVSAQAQPQQVAA
ncbi:hypothetical protein ACQVP2_29485 [Methylobacterium aquaticum]|uniref:hypothetical protein n=1 Tax=Methylobacterium aquaticum TaxID=270351 RepID=UPI003D168779